MNRRMVLPVLVSLFLLSASTAVYAGRPIARQYYAAYEKADNQKYATDHNVFYGCGLEGGQPNLDLELVDDLTVDLVAREWSAGSDGITDYSQASNAFELGASFYDSPTLEGIEYLKLANYVYNYLNEEVCGQTIGYWHDDGTQQNGNCEDSWPDDIATVGFEDLPLEHNGMDFDYNDWLFNTFAASTYNCETDEMSIMTLFFEAKARGAFWHHDNWLSFPAGAFDQGGSPTYSGDYVARYFDEGGLLIGEATGGFTEAIFEVKLFGDTWVALPPDLAFDAWTANTVSGGGPSQPKPGYSTEVSLYFDTPIGFDLSVYTDAVVGIHGGGLFFDPYLAVHGPSYGSVTEEIHQGDPRMVVVPIDWSWPSEHTRIWNAYPIGVSPGPVFSAGWYSTTPNNSYLWAP